MMEHDLAACSSAGACRGLFVHDGVDPVTVSLLLVETKVFPRLYGGFIRAL